MRLAVRELAVHEAATTSTESTSTDELRGLRGERHRLRAANADPGTQVGNLCEDIVEMQALVARMRRGVAQSPPGRVGLEGARPSG